MNENNNQDNPLEPVADALLEFIALSLELSLKISCNILVLLSKYVSEVCDGISICYRLATGTYEYEENKYIEENYEYNGIGEIASTENNNVLILTNKLSKYTSNFKEYKTNAIDVNYVPLEPLSFERSLPTICKYRSNDGNIEDTLIAYVGVDEKGKQQPIDFFEEGSILVGGMSRWGKTSFILSMLSSIMERYDPSQLKIILVDFKGIDLVHFNGYKHILSNCVTDLEGFKKVLSWVDEEIKRRTPSFKKAKVQNIKDFNKKNPNMKFQPIIIVIDEIAVMLNSFNKKADADKMRNDIGKLVSVSMGFGIYWVVCTQELSRETLGKMKNNFGQRVGFHTADTDATDLIIKNGELELIQYPGRAKIQNSKGIEEFQSYYITLEEVFERLEPFKKVTKVKV